MCGACILYWFFGQYLPARSTSRLRLSTSHHPSVVRHRRVLRRADLCFGNLHFSVYPVRLFLEHAGMIQLFTDVSLGLFGRTRGGPAKVAVFASGMMGTISAPASPMWSPSGSSRFR